MFKLMKLAFLSAALVCLCSSTLSAQLTFQGDWTGFVNSGGRGTAVARGAIRNGVDNDGFRSQSVTSRNLLLVQGELLNFAEMPQATANVGSTSTATSTSLPRQGLTAASIVNRSLAGLSGDSAFLRSRTLGQSNGTWVYRGDSVQSFDFTLRLRVDQGVDRNPRPFGEFLLDDDFDLTPTERADVNGVVTMNIPGVGFIVGASFGPRATVFMGPPGVQIDISDDTFSGTVRGVQIEPGTVVQVGMNANSDMLLRQILPETELFELRSSVIENFSISKSRFTLPPRL